MCCEVQKKERKLSSLKSFENKELDFKIYEDGSLKDIADILESLYHCPYCTLNFIRISNSNVRINALFIQHRGIPIHILLFSIKKRRVTILNMLYSISEEYINYVSEVIFEKYKEVRSVDFRKIYGKSSKNIIRPHLRIDLNHDILIQLPDNFEFYFSKLGKKTRHHLRQYSKKLEKRFTNVKFNVMSSNEITDDIVSQIVGFNRARMLQKGVISYVTTDIEKKLCAFSKIKGSIAVITLNDRVVAGTIFSKVGEHIYLDMISHDLIYDKYELGTLCLLNTISHCIKIKAKTIHMLYGTPDYKHQFLGKDKEVLDIAVFRYRTLMIPAYYDMLLIACKHQFIYSKKLVGHKLLGNKILRGPLMKIRKEIGVYLNF
jgi:hypothetical protein